MMVFPDPNQFRGEALKHVEPIGTWRCPSCSLVEKENEKLKAEVLRLTRLLELTRDEEDNFPQEK